ncbi:choline transporter-like protein 1 isoform X2 [Strongylocentrotus purpuratus]|uniref:Choline transporter-like protein n=1 Tax=Strongylocentrotus purpuratus TaxID=7668 RepID=A0A7M7NM78_STRPU|nr:choline transporter-like protein 1 isoform X2 [Strongylocentrotus purpuratus]
MSCCGGQNRVRPFNDGPVQVEDDFNGPLSERSCRDIPCLIIFLAFLGGMGYVTYLALRDGNPDRLIYGDDSYGNICGKKNNPIENVSLSGRDMTDKPYVFFFDDVAMSKLKPTSKRLCVSRCNNETVFTRGGLRDLAVNNITRLCTYDVDVDDYVHATQGGMGECPQTPIAARKPILFRCVRADVIGVASSLLQNDIFQSALADIEKSWREIVYLCLIAFGLSITVVIALRFLAAYIIWSMVFGFILGSMGGSGFLWYMWYIARAALRETPAELQLAQDKSNLKTTLIYASVATTVTAILLLILLVMFKRIALVVTLFKEAGKAIGAMPFLLTQPLWTSLFLLSFCAAWVYIYLYIATAGHPKATPDGLVEYVKDSFSKYMGWYYIFGLLWVTQFILACQECTIAGAIAEWFFARDKSLLSTPILKSIYRIIRYHLGSLAFGSLLIAIIMFIRIVLGYIQSKLKGAKSAPAQYCLKCMQCILWLFEKVLRYINRNAYIEIAIYGYNFCKAAQKAFSVLVSNALRVAAINSVGDFLLLLGKFAVTACVVVIGLQLLQDREDLNCYAIPIALAGVCAFFISHVFLLVYEMAIDTLFLCFCEDSERNDGVQKPYYMSKQLMTFVENAKKAQAISKDAKDVAKEARV